MVKRTVDAWSRTERVSKTRWNIRLLNLSHLCWRSPQRLIIDPPSSVKYRSSHGLTNIAVNAANAEQMRLKYMNRAMLSWETLGSATSLSDGDAALTSIMKAELTAESRPA